MKTRYKVIIMIVSLATAYAFGRFSAPEKIKIETKVVEIEKKDKKIAKDIEKNKRKDTKTVRITKPTGEKVVIIREIEDSSLDVKTRSNEKEEKLKAEASKKEEQKTQGRVTVSVLGGVDITNPNKIIYGGSVTKPILGPVTIGLFGLTDGVCGGSIGLQF